MSLCLIFCFICMETEALGKVQSWVRPRVRGRLSPPSASQPGAWRKLLGAQALPTSKESKSSRTQKLPWVCHALGV